MNCPKCDRELVQYARFCGYCGERLVVTCPSCQVLNPPDGRFCYNCGVGLTEADSRIESPGPVSDEREQPQVAAIRCPRCETVNEPGSKYCYKCGLPLEEEQPQTPVNREARPIRDVPHRPGSAEQVRTPQASVAGEPPVSAPSAKLPVRKVSTRVLANWTTGLLVVTCVVLGLCMIQTIALLDIVSEHGRLAPLMNPEFDDTHDRVGTMFDLLIVVCIPTVILFLVWIHRVSENLRFLGALGQRFSPGWAVGSWFVPLVNLFRPYQVMGEIWRGSDPDLRSVGRIDWKYGSSTPLLGWWWGLWVTFGLVGVVAWFVWAGETQAVPSAGAVWWYLLAGALMVGTGVLAILIVRRVTAMQEEKHRRMTIG